MIQKLSGWMALIGGVSGIITLLAIAVYGGEMKRQVEINTHRLDVVEANGSPKVKEHERMDDQRIGEIQRRLAALEEAVLKIADIRADLKSINTKLDMLSDDVRALQSGQKKVP